MSYWSYYEDVPHNCSATATLIGNAAESRDALLGLGYTPDEVTRLSASGYLAVPEYQVLIDRYYGGLLSSGNLTSRFELGRSAVDTILAQRAQRQRPVPVYSAKSGEQVHEIVSRIVAPAHRRLVFRGQEQHYRTARELPNRYFTTASLGETSLLPSLWRRVLRTCPYCAVEFMGWSLLEWSTVLYRPFDIEAIDAAIIASGGNPGLLTMSDMADHPDPIVSEFGKFRYALSVDHQYRLATALNTLLQHYGLLSPVLDVTTRLDVAMFFATHRFEVEGRIARYSYVGSNTNQASLYVMWNDPREMEELPRDLVLEKQPALRPRRQSCVVVRSGPHAMNLAADFLLAVIRLEGNGPWNCGFGVQQLFPGPSDDLFLRALKEHKRAAQRLTDFADPFEGA